MFYKVTIKDTNGGSVVFNTKKSGNVQDGSLKNIRIMVDTVEENVNDRSSKVLNKLQLEILISKDTQEQCRYIMDWALDSASDTVHRQVCVNVYDSNGKDVRSFDLGNMFVEDYIEEYAGDDEKCVMTLKLIQKAGYSDDFKHDIEALS